MDESAETEVVIVDNVARLPLHLPGRLYAGQSPEKAVQNYVERTGQSCRAWCYTGAPIGGKPWQIVFVSSAFAAESAVE